MGKTTIAVWALLALLWPVSLLALDPVYEAALERELRWFVLTAPPYVWGSAEDKAADCSGMVFRAYQRAGIPGPKRTTALFMSKGAAGWTGKDIKHQDADGSSLIWFTWKGMETTRPNGHVGAIQISEKSGLLEVVHASQTAKKTIRQPYGGKLERDTSLLRRITIGER